MFRLIQAALPVNDESTADKVPEVIADIRTKIRQHIIEDLLETGAKLKSVSAIADERVLLLEQAAVIRHNAQRIWTNLHALDMFADEDGTPVIPPEYVEVLDHELAAFRERFRRWVEVSPLDGLPDAWGLFFKRHVGKSIKLCKSRNFISAAGFGADLD